MPNQTYLPRADKDKVVWLRNFATKFNSYAGLLGFSTAEVAAITADYTMYAYMVDSVELFKAEQAKRVAYKNLLINGELGTPISIPPGLPVLPTAPTAVPAGIFKRLAKVVQRIKNHTAYNDAMGADLNIIAAPSAVDTSAMKPVLKPALDAGRPLIKWKKGDADAINIYVDRHDGKGFVFLAHDTQPDYVDTFEMPAGISTAAWDYKAIYLVGDEQVGSFSDSVSVTVTKNVGVLQ